MRINGKIDPRLELDIGPGGDNPGASAPLILQLNTAEPDTLMEVCNVIADHAPAFEGSAEGHRNGIRNRIDGSLSAFLTWEQITALAKLNAVKSFEAIQ